MGIRNLGLPAPHIIQDGFHVLKRVIEHMKMLLLEGQLNHH